MLKQKIRWGAAGGSFLPISTTFNFVPSSTISWAEVIAVQSPNKGIYRNWTIPKITFPIWGSFGCHIFKCAELPAFMHGTRFADWVFNSKPQTIMTNLKSPQRKAVRLALQILGLIIIVSVAVMARAGKQNSSTGQEQSNNSKLLTP